MTLFIYDFFDSFINNLGCTFNIVDFVYIINIQFSYINTDLSLTTKSDMKNCTSGPDNPIDRYLCFRQFILFPIIISKSILLCFLITFLTILHAIFLLWFPFLVFYQKKIYQKKIYGNEVLDLLALY